MTSNFQFHRSLGTTIQATRLQQLRQQSRMLRLGRMTCLRHQRLQENNPAEVKEL
jgi:hypothetical protein